MSRRSLDILLAGGLAALAFGLTLAGAAAGPLRALAGIPLALALPGYALAAALFPQQGIGRLERAALAGGLSIAVTIGLGFALHLLPWGLTPVSWAAALALWTWAAGAAAVARRRHVAEPASEPGWPSLGFAAGQGLLVLAAAGVLVGALALSRSEASVQPADAVLQLWMLPADPGAPRLARIGIISSGTAAGTFRLRVQRDGRLLREWPALAIAPGQRWEATIDTGPPGDPLSAGPVEGLLSAAGAPGEPLRHVIYWPQAKP